MANARPRSLNPRCRLAPLSCRATSTSASWTLRGPLSGVPLRKHAGDLGKPGEPALQKWILMDALGLLVADPRPGEVIERDYTST